MAGTRKVGDKIPLAVVGKDGISEASEQESAMKTDDERDTTVAQLAESLKALRAQVESLSASLAKASGKATKAVTHSAEAATDTVTETVRAYPFYSVLAASAAAFLLGRLSANPTPSRADHAYDRFSVLASRLQPHLMEAVRGRLR
jgi:ElaB/YqjD/DUF883 family membrane-anchored ribosome-binding protein